MRPLSAPSSPSVCHGLSAWAFAALLLCSSALPRVALAQTVGASTVAHGCNGNHIRTWGLRAQLARAQSCMYPDRLAEITPGGRLTFSSGDTLRFATPQVRDALYGARDAGVSIQVNSAFRNLLEQWWLHTARSPACGAVATPGSSNHESGSAIDVQNYSSARAALEARGCRWPNISADPWHFDCVSAPRTTVLVFQRLWNLNNPGDRISEDNSWGPQTEARLRASPIAGFANDGCAPVSCDRTAGRFTFSCDGPNSGAHCVSLNVPGDPDSWADNYLCSAADEGFAWSTTGPIAGMRCVSVTESADPHASAWANVHACAPAQAPYELRWSSSGAVAGWDCVHFNEAADPGTWTDNFLCARAVSRFENGDFAFSASGTLSDMTCESVNEPSDPHTWSDNFFCSRRPVGMVWSHDGPIDGMRCTLVNEPADAQAAAWMDNYLCLPEDSPYLFTWSSSGPLSGQTCVRWYEAADLAGTWHDNYLCVSDAPTPDAGVALPDAALFTDDAAFFAADAGVLTRDAARTLDAGSDREVPREGGGIASNCGCRVTRSSPPSPAWFALGALGLLVARRRRRAGAPRDV